MKSRGTLEQHNGVWVLMAISAAGNKTAVTAWEDYDEALDELHAFNGGN